MSRLIDADELMNYCLNLKEKKIDCNDISRFPTAYNVDQVVKELERYKRHAVRNSIIGIDVATKMIEIVKRGGVND